MTVTSGDFTVTNSFAMNGSGTVTIANSFQLISAPATVAINSGTLAVDRTDDLTGFSAVPTDFTGAGTFLKQNTNTVELTGDNSGFTGTATVEAGRFALAGPTH